MEIITHICTPMIRYPFIVRTPHRMFAHVVEALTHDEALDKILALYPGKFVQLKYSLPMDLISAKVDAAQQSKGGDTVYVFIQPDGEVELSTTYPKDPTSLLHAYRAGSELKSLPPPPENESGSPDSTTKSKNKKQQTVMETPTKTAAKKAPAKKSAKKVAKKVAKKTAAKTATKAGKYNLEPGEPIKGTKKSATVKELIKLAEGGSTVYNEKFRPLPLGYLKKMADHTRVIEATIVAPAKA